MWLAVILGVLLVVSIALDPRKFRVGVYLLGLLLAAAMALFVVLGHQLDQLDSQVAQWFAVAALCVVVAAVPVLGLFLVANGVTMWRKEARKPANLLSLALGLAVLAYVAFGVTAVATNAWTPAMWFLASGLPVSYLAFGFVAFLLYSPLYQFGARHLFRRPAAVIVLGAGLIGGRVPPLLAGRLDRGRQVYAKALTAERAADPAPVLVTSGGQGPDEPRPEAAAMADYLVAQGIDRAAIVVEDTSRTTRENLVNSQALLAERGVTGQVAVVTNNYHAFRAALLMRRLKIRGHAIGAPTARYYWPSAVIREYAAILLDHRLFNGLALLVTLVPLVLLALS